MTNSFKLTLTRIAGVISLFVIAPQFYGVFNSVMIGFSLFLIIWPTFARRSAVKHGRDLHSREGLEENHYQRAYYEQYQAPETMR